MSLASQWCVDSDDRGRVIGEASGAHVDTAKLVGTLPMRQSTTVYAHFGDCFAWTCLAVFLCCPGLSLRRAIP